MKYTKEQRLNIGKQIYENKLTKYEASIQYDISIDCARDYMRLYRNTNNLLPKSNFSYDVSITNSSSSSALSEYETMSKEELIKEIIKLKVNESRLKKGYTVEGVGAKKVFIPLNNKNIK